MYNCFISIISLLQPDPQLIRKFLINTHRVLKENFSDFEIILVNNRLELNIDSIFQNLDMDILKNVAVINLSKRIDLDNAVVAGLDAANGDYNINLNLCFADNADVIIDLYKKTQENFDIVYLRYKNRRLPFIKKLFYKLFYFIMNKFSMLDIDIEMHSNRIISRRALNAVLQYRESWRYMKGLYAFVGYNTSFIEINVPEHLDIKQSFSSQISSAIKAITSFTDLVNKILLWLCLVSFLFCVIVGANAFFVKYLHSDIFGNPTRDVPGWTFLVSFLALGFSFQTFILYIISFYLSGINSEIKRRPLYIIESLKRF